MGQIHHRQKCCKVCELSFPPCRKSTPITINTNPPPSAYHEIRHIPSPRVTTPLRRPNNSHQEDGFSLSLVLVASLMVLLGGLMLVDRASDGVISAAFQRDSSDASDAAETGMTRIVGELNRPQNRGLLAKKLAAPTPPATAGAGRMQMHR